MFFKVLGAISTVLRTASDFSAIADSKEKYMAARDHDRLSKEQEQILRTYSIAMGILSLATNVTGLSASALGASNAALAGIKRVEHLSRILHAPAQTAEACLDCTENGQFMEKGILIPLAGICRSGFELQLLENKELLDLSPKDLEKRKEPILESTNEYPYYHDVPKVVDFKPINLDECRENITFAEKGITATKVTEYGLKLYRPFTAINTIYLIYKIFFPSPLEEEVEIAEAPLPVNLRRFSRILPDLHNDPVLKLYICVIGRVPVRDPVNIKTRDSTGQTFLETALYERSAIATWMETSNTSPTTRRDIVEIVSQEAIKTIINERLHFHETNIARNYAETGMIAAMQTSFNQISNQRV